MNGESVKPAALRAQPVLKGVSFANSRLVDVAPFA